MDFFSLLREHARTRTETIAVASPRRSMTYRKLWSRIERATARLQCEWGVGRADTVVYCGDSHPDALVLLFALARCGANVLPLQASYCRTEPSLLPHGPHLRLLLRDDDLPLAAGPSLPPVKPLSSLIATRCPYYPCDLPEDPGQTVLLCMPTDGHAAAPNAYSLSQLWLPHAASSIPAEVRATMLLNPNALSHCVLPVLQNGGCLVLP